MTATSCAFLGSRGEPARFTQGAAAGALTTWLFHLSVSASGADATGLVPVVNISKAGAAFGAAAGVITEISGGWYKIAFTAADLATLGPLGVNVAIATADPINVTHYVDAINRNDAVRAGLTALPNAALGATGGFATDVTRGGTAQAGGASTITLDAGASATDSEYVGDTIKITGGTGAGQPMRAITGYVGSSKVATVDAAWLTNPDSTSVFEITPSKPGDNVSLSAGAISAATFATGAIDVGTFTAAALAAMGASLVDGPNVLNGTITETATLQARSMKGAQSVIVTLAGVFGGATVEIQTTEDENAGSPVWTDQSSGGYTSAHSLTLTGPHSAWRAIATSGASGTTAVTVTSATITYADAVR